MTKLPSSLPRYMAIVCAGVIFLLPFHAFMTVWLSSGVGHYTLLRLWKEALVLLLCLGLAVLMVQRPELRRAVRRERLIGLIALYVLLVVGIGAVVFLAGGVSLKALAYGVLLDTRYLIFFVITWAVTQYDDLLVRWWQRLLLIPAGVVAIFAALQYALLPADFLKHFGYSPQTIPPTSTIDQQVAYRRVQSTLRGANPLGAYLVLVLSAWGVLITRTKKIRWLSTFAYVVSGLALMFTFSRSAWLGAIVATALLLWLLVTSHTARRYITVALVSFVVAFGAVAFTLRHNTSFENVVFHTSSHSHSAKSSNQGHLSALTGGLHDIVHMPWGSGTGTAGPASVYNHAGKASTRIAENYYIQIGQETGVVGLVLFGAINVLVARRLLMRRGDRLALTLLVSFGGLVVVNLLLHAWADDTLAYIWWGLAGAAIAMPVHGETS